MRRALVALTVTAAALLLAGAAGGAFPGRNGRLAFDGLPSFPPQLETVSVSGEHASLGDGSSPIPSPDGRKVVFARERESSGWWIRRDERGGPELLPCVETPSWAPDSRRIACTFGGAVNVFDTETGASTRLGEGSQPRWSPDGAAIAYLRGIPAELVVVAPDGSSERSLAFEVFDMTWSPDGSKLAYSSLEGESYSGEEDFAHSLWVVPVTGGEAVQLPTDDFAEIFGIVFSSDGTRVSYVEDRNQPRSDAVVPDEVYAAAADGSGRVRLPCDETPAWSPSAEQVACSDNGDLNVVTFAGSSLTINFLDDGFSPAWSPDGSLIVFRGEGIEVVRPDGSDRRTLAPRPAESALDDPTWLGAETVLYTRTSTASEREVLTSRADGSGLVRRARGSADDFQPAWSPDGRRIAYVHEIPAKHPDRDIGNHEIYVMNADGTHKRRITRHAGFDWQPAWSPDGKRIAFIREYADVKLDLAVVDVRTKRVRRLSKSEYDEKWPAWSPRGRWIAFVFEDVNNAWGEGGVLTLIHPNGKGRKRLHTPGVVLHPTWSPDGRRIAYQRDDYPCPATAAHCDAITSLWAVGADGRGARQLSSQKIENPAWSPDGRLVAGNGGLLLDLRTGAVRILDPLAQYDAQSLDWQPLRG